MADEHPNATVFRRGYAAFNSGDMDTIRELFDENIVWHAAGRSRFSRDSHGIDETLGFFLELVQASDGTFHLDVHDIVANDEHAVALVTSHQEIGGVKYEDLGSHVVHMKDGKVTESWFSRGTRTSRTSSSRNRPRRDYRAGTCPRSTRKRSSCSTTKR